MRPAPWVAWAIVVAFIVLSAAALAIDLSDPEMHLLTTGEYILQGIPLLIFAIVGGVVVTRRSRNWLGWIFIAIPLSVGLQAFAQAYGHHGLLTSPGSLPFAPAIAWLATWLWLPGVALPITLIPLLFPDGRPPSPRWRWLARTALAGIVLVAIAASIHPDAMRDASLPDVDNPLAVAGVTSILEVVLPIGGGLIVFSALGAAVAIIFRFLRSHGEERLQMKWFAYAATVNVVVNFATSLLVDLSRPVDDVVFVTGITLLPVATGVAILKYRLYDIDVIVNRTLVYGSLTAILAGAYVAIVFALQAGLSPFTNESDLAIAASTLAVAALFRPLRGRVQGFIDKRFYRRKFDMQITLDGFGAHVRDEVEIASLSARLVSVVNETMQPTHVSLWLRGNSPELRS